MKMQLLGVKTLLNQLSSGHRFVFLLHSCQFNYFKTLIFIALYLVKSLLTLYKEPSFIFEWRFVKLFLTDSGSELSENK